MAVFRKSFLKLLLATCLLVSLLDNVSEAREIRSLRIAREAASSSDDVSADFKKLEDGDKAMGEDDDDDLAMGDEGVDDDFLNDGSNGSEDDEEYNEDGEEDSALPAKIVSGPEEFTVAEGSTVWLPCEIINGDSDVIMWKKGETIIFQSTYQLLDDTRFFEYPNRTMKIDNVKPSDAGNYTCEIVSEANVTHSLKLFTAPQIVKMLPTDSHRLVKEGETLRVECITSGNPQPKLKWSREGVRIMNAEFDDHSVIISNVKRTDSGMYQCLASNGYGKPAHGAVNIKVLHAPAVHVKKSVVNTDDGYEATILCAVQSEPRAIISWEKDGKEISQSHKHHISFHKDGTHSNLKIIHVTSEDFGKYVCKAANEYGVSYGHTIVMKTPERALWVDSKDDNSVDDIKTLKWVVDSIQPLTEVELKYLKIDESNPDLDKDEGNWILVKPSITEPTGNKYTLIHTLTGLVPGKYAAKTRSKNTHGWSEVSTSYVFDGDFMSNEIKADERIEEAPVAEIGISSSMGLSSSTILVLLSVIVYRLV